MLAYVSCDVENILPHIVNMGLEETEVKNVPIMIMTSSSLGINYLW